MLAKIVDFPAKAPASRPEASVTSILSFLNKVSNVADQTHSFKQAAGDIFKLICAYTQWPIAHIYLKDGDRYVSKGIWFYETRIDPAAMSDFKRISEETVFEVGKGIIGQIAKDCEARALEDVTVLPQFLRADVAKRSGVRGFFGFPILVEGECVGVAEFYGRQKAVLDETSLEMMQFVSAQLARIYEREGHSLQQKKLLDRFENSVQAAVDGLVLTSNELVEARNGVQEQVAHNSTSCTKVVAGRNSIMENMGTLEQAVSRLVDVESHTVEAAATVGNTVNALSANVHCAHTELASLGALTMEIEGIARNVSEIAGQVKMLGLNASIEAARAGTAGKGFAIVASEIKSLAHQSEASSQQIAEQLGKIQVVAQKSASLMMDVNGSMGTLEETTQQMHDVVSDQHEATQTIRHGLGATQSTFGVINEDIETLTATSHGLSELANKVGALVEDLQNTSVDISESSAGFIRAMKQG